MHDAGAVEGVAADGLGGGVKVVGAWGRTPCAWLFSLSGNFSTAGRAPASVIPEPHGRASARAGYRGDYGEALELAGGLGAVEGGGDPPGPRKWKGGGGGHHTARIDFFARKFCPRGSCGMAGYTQFAPVERKSRLIQGRRGGS